MNWIQKLSENIMARQPGQGLFQTRDQVSPTGDILQAPRIKVQASVPKRVPASCVESGPRERNTTNDQP
ncbi:hypothetical protein MYX84_12295 [Acidobacteria bacterium AH-259-O06]|nr:hypothetical protein [Acidobacteria bacterium AH-259-O06]